MLRISDILKNSDLVEISDEEAIICMGGVAVGHDNDINNDMVQLASGNFSQGQGGAGNINCFASDHYGNGSIVEPRCMW